MLFANLMLCLPALVTAYLVRNVYQGATTGVISTRREPIVLRESPMPFWFLMAAEACLAIYCGFYVLKELIRIVL